MSNALLRTLLCGLNMGLLFAASPALAQVGNAGLQAGASDDAQEIVVTAQKRVQNINDVGLTVSAISGAALQQRQVSTLADVAAQVPGLSFTNSASNTPVYTLRGVGFYETTLGGYPDVSTYLDEAPLPFPVLSALTAFDLERLEVLKGPQGTLFGNNATGGSINYIAAKPTDHFTAGASLGYGRFDQIVGEGYVSGPLAEGLTARISGRIEHASAWQKGYSFNGKTGKTRQYAGRFLVDWHASDRLRVQFNLNGWKDGGEPQALQFIQARQGFAGGVNQVENYPVAPRNARAADFTANIDPHLDNRLYQGIGRIDYDLADDVTLTSLSSYVHYKQDMAYDGDGVTLSDFDFPAFQGKITSFSQEVRIANSGKTQFRWVVGANYSQDKASDYYDTLYLNSTLAPSGLFRSNFSSSQKMKNYAGFANAEYDIGRLTAKAGLRYTQANRRATSCFSGDPSNAAAFAATYNFIADAVRAANGLAPGPRVTGIECLTIDTTGINGAAPTYLSTRYFGKLNENNLSWRVGIDWKPSRGTLLYANVTKGYKAGSFPSAAAATTAQLLPVKQESVLSYEGGYKLSLMGGQLQLNGAAFYYDYRDKQLRSKLVDPFFGVLDALVNVPKSSVKGIEGEIAVRPNQYFSAYVNAIYLDAKVKRFTGYNGEGVLGDFAGYQVPYAPKLQVSTGFDANVPVSETLSAFAGADLAMRGDAISVIGGSQAYKIDGYATLDLRIGIKDADDRWRFQLWGKNVTNSYYWTNVTSFYDTLARYTGRPATYGATLSFAIR